MLIIVAVVAVVAVAGIAAVLLMGGSNNPATPSITVNSPAQDSSHVRGSALNIQWTKTGDTGSTVKIEYGHLSVQTMTIIAASASNTGSYSWNIPSGIATGTDYYILVMSNSNTSVWGTSGSFAITAGGTSYVGTITVTGPTAGASYVRGTSMNIQWTSTGNIGTNVKVEYKRNADSTWTLIVASVANSGSYSWGIPSGIAAATDYKVKVTSTSNTSIYDDSAAFTITAGGGTGIQVGQFTNYTLQYTITNNTGIYESTGYYRYDAIAVTATNVTYSFTQSMTTNGQTYNYSYETTYNLTTGFGGMDLNNAGSGVTITAIGSESLSTAWGSKSCQKYAYNYSSESGYGDGYLWVHDNVFMKYDVTMNSAYMGYTSVHMVLILTDTNLPSVTS